MRGIDRAQTPPAPQEDAQLALAAKSGDGAALERLLERYAPFVRRRTRVYARRALEAEDLFQEGMLALLKAVRCYRPGRSPNFGAFAAVCVNHKLISALRAHMRQKNAPLREGISLSDPGLPEPAARDPSHQDPQALVIAREERADRARRMEALLSPLERQVLALYLEGLRYEQIAGRLSTSPKAVDNPLQRVRRKLRGAFPRE